MIKKEAFSIFSPKQTSKALLSSRILFFQFLLLSQIWQRRSEDLNSILTALQIWDFQATRVWSSVFVTQRPKILHDLIYPLSPWASHTRRHVVLRPVFVTSGSSLSTTLTSVSNAFTDFWGLTYFLSKFYQTNQQVSISLLSKIMDFFKGFNCESIYCCEEWTMIKNFELSVCRFLAMISERRIWGWATGDSTGEVEYALNVIIIYKRLTNLLCL